MAQPTSILTYPVSKLHQNTVNPTQERYNTLAGQQRQVGWIGALANVSAIRRLVLYLYLYLGNKMCALLSNHILQNSVHNNLQVYWTLETEEWWRGSCTCVIAKQTNPSIGCCPGRLVAAETWCTHCKTSIHMDFARKHFVCMCKHVCMCTHCKTSIYMDFAHFVCMSTHWMLIVAQT